MLKTGNVVKVISQNKSGYSVIQGMNGSYPSQVLGPYEHCHYKLINQTTDMLQSCVNCRIFAANTYATLPEYKYAIIKPLDYLPAEFGSKQMYHV